MRFSVLILFSIFFLVGCGIDPNKTNQDKSNQVKQNSKFPLENEELCNLLYYDANEQTGILLNKGFKEDKSLTQNHWLYEDNHAIFNIEGLGRIIIPTDVEGEYHLIFNSDQRNAYAKFVSQFPEITSAFPTIEEKRDSTSKFSINITEKCFVHAFGYDRDSQGYLLMFYKGY